MDVVTLGTGTPIPDPNRAGPAMLVRAAGKTLLVDCGRGVLHAPRRRGAFPPMLDALLLTHLHSDHITDLNDVITTRWVMSPVESPLPVVGPPGTAGLVDRTLAMLGADIGTASPTTTTSSGSRARRERGRRRRRVESADGVRVIAAPTDHQPGRTRRSGTGSRRGRRPTVVRIAGDTVPCEGLDRLCAGADVYVQTVVRADLVARSRTPASRTSSTTTRRARTPAAPPRRPASARSSSPTPSPARARERGRVDCAGRRALRRRDRPRPRPLVDQRLIRLLRRSTARGA